MIISERLIEFNYHHVARVECTATAKVLGVEEVNGWLYLILQEDQLTTEMVKRHFVRVGSGWEYELGNGVEWRYIDSKRQDEYLWHIFEEVG